MPSVPSGSRTQIDHRGELGPQPWALTPTDRSAWPPTAPCAPEGVALRQQLEDDTDRRSTDVWECLGEEASIRFAEDFEPPCELLLQPIDLTAGPNHQPASRLRD